VKIVAAIALAGGTAGGLALAADSRPTQSRAATTDATDATSGAHPPGIAVTTAAASADADRSNESADTAVGGESGSTGTGEATQPPVAAPRPTGQCRAAADSHPGKAAGNPAHDDVSCSDSTAGTETTDTAKKAKTTGKTKTTGHPTTPPGKPDHDTGKPDTHRAGGSSKNQSAKNTAAGGRNPSNSGKQAEKKGSSEKKSDGQT
jgi:hypothetical protein